MYGPDVRSVAKPDCCPAPAVEESSLDAAPDRRLADVSILLPKVEKCRWQGVRSSVRLGRMHTHHSHARVRSEAKPVPETVSRRSYYRVPDFVLRAMEFMAR